MSQFISLVPATMAPEQDGGNDYVSEDGMPKWLQYLQYAALITPLVLLVLYLTGILQRDRAVLFTVLTCVTNSIIYGTWYYGSGAYKQSSDAPPSDQASVVTYATPSTPQTNTTSINTYWA